MDKSWKKTSPPPLYAIWAEAGPDSPLSGQSGYLSEDNKLLHYHKKSDADLKIHDLQSRCMNHTPATSFLRVSYPGGQSEVPSISVETINLYDLQPDFAPSDYERRSVAYGNTGGGCMVGVVSFHLPSLGKTVWVNCNDEGVTITSADYIWNDDHSDSFERYEDVKILSANFQTAKPEELGVWLPMIQEALEYTIDQQSCRHGWDFRIPAVWLPESYRQKADPSYIAWALEYNSDVTVVPGGVVALDKSYMMDQKPPGPSLITPC